MSDAALLADLAAGLSRRVAPGQVLVVGLTGSVAVGKSTLGAALVEQLSARHRVEALSTDGFILPNARLAELGLSLRKGYPESYDAGRLASAIGQARLGPTVFPGYNHMTYDADPARDRLVEQPDILLLEGLGFAPPQGDAAARALDLLIYLDADEADLEAWFLRRFLGFWRDAEHDPTSFYAQFRGMTEPEAVTFARGVWAGINLPNLREHIVQVRDRADIVLRKAGDHRLSLVR
ncbi:MAG: hypothetical protein KF842_12070 [Caulobacter sp.]|nr:hypothetical protein [Caulobacter sp.]